MKHLIDIPGRLFSLKVVLWSGAIFLALPFTQLSQNALAASEIGKRCEVISKRIPFITRQRGDRFRASAVYTRKVKLKKGDKVLILGSLRSRPPKRKKRARKMILGSFLAVFKRKPKPYFGGRKGSKYYKVSDKHGRIAGWRQISPALAYNVTRKQDKYGILNNHAIYTAKRSGNHWIAMMGYAATTRKAKVSSVLVALPNVECDLIAVKLD